MTRHVFELVAANLLLGLLGCGLLLLIDLWRRLGRWTRPAVALLAGQAAFAAVAPLLLYADLSLSPVIIVPLIAAVLVAGVAVARRRGRPAEPRSGGGGLIAAAVLAVPLVVLAVRAALRPPFQFDTMSNWLMKAAVIWSGGHRLTGVLDARLFANPSLHPQSHLEYPLGMNALLAWDFHWMGAVDPRVVHLQHVLVLAAFAGTAWALLRPIVPALPLTAGLTGLVIMPALVDQLLTAYADVPMACLWAAGAIALMRWSAERERGLLALATLLLAGALAVKHDALFYNAGVYLAIGLPLLVRQRRRLLELAVSAGVVVLSAVPWQLYSAVHSLSSTDIRPSLARMQAQTSNLQPTADSLGHVLTSQATLLAVPLAAVFAVVCVVRGRRSEALPFLIAGLVALGGMALIYWNAAVTVQTLLGVSASRITMGLIILSWTLLPALVFAAVSPREPDGAPVPAAAAAADAGTPD